jgi:hypothetical protein
VTPAERLNAAVERTAELTASRPRRGTTHDEAVDTRGSIETDDAHRFDPRPLLRRLSTVPVPVVVIGQVAGILHGSVELTGDLDLLWSGDDGHASAMASAFAAEASALTDDDGRPLACDNAAFVRAKVQFKTDHASGDCCTTKLPWGALDVASFIERADRADFGGSTVRYLTKADLIAMRVAVGRPKDLRRAEELRRLGP